MSIADIIIGIMVVLGALNGYRQGFLMELISLAAVIFGVFCGFKLMGEGILLLENNFDIHPGALPYVSFVVIFLVVVFLVRLLGKMVKGSIKQTMLGSLDHVAGACFGAFRMLFVLSIMFWIVDSIKIIPPSSWTEESRLYPFTAKLAPSFANWLGEYIPLFREIFREF